MPFEKGKSGNPRGKPKGAKSKTTREVKAIITQILADNVARANKELQALKGKAFIDAFTKLAGIVMPRTIAQDDDSPLKIAIDIVGDASKLKDSE